LACTSDPQPSLEQGTNDPADDAQRMHQLTLTVSAADGSGGETLMRWPDGKRTALACARHRGQLWSRPSQSKAHVAWNS
jgi:hypothetical protein